MSIESAKAFVKKIQEDDEFRKDFFECSDTETKKRFLKDKGYEFTKDELDECQILISEISGGGCCGMGETCTQEAGIQPG